MPIVTHRGSRIRGGRTGLALVAAAGLMIVLSACTANPAASDAGGTSGAGGSGELKSGNEQTAFDDWQRDFSSCMSDQGVEMGGFASTSLSNASGGLDESSETEGGTLGAMGEGEIDMKAFEAASKVCTKKLGEMPVPPGMPSQEEAQASMLAFAKCMRAAGYDYPDPEVSSGGGMLSVKAMPADDYDPAVLDKCSAQSFPSSGKKAVSGK
jgi:hypothetical protein